MDPFWEQWLMTAWQQLVAGNRVGVPAHLPHPRWSGLEERQGGWEITFADGRTLLVSEIDGDASTRVAELRSRNPLQEVLTRATAWASQHPKAVGAIGLGFVVGLLAILLGKAVAALSSCARVGPAATQPPGEDGGTAAPGVLGDATATQATRTAPGEARDAVAASFAKLLSAIQPGKAEISCAESHANSIEAALKDAFALNRIMIVGSHSRRTAVRGISDVDYFAVVAREDARWGGKYASSDTVLKNVRVALQERFKKTDVGKDGQAVVVSFAKGEDPVDVVPAVFLGMSANGRPLYRMPDGRGGWLETSPEGHNKYIEEANARSGKKLRATAQFLKYWRECRASRVPIQSFYIELRLAVEDVCRVGVGYSECLVAALERLERAQCQPVTDPLGVSGEVPACATEPKRRAAAEAIGSALAYARTALDAERSGNRDGAWRAWNGLFNDTFPE